VFSAPVVSVSMPVVLRGAKKFRVDTAFGGILKVADNGTVLVQFFDVCDVFLETCLLRLYTYSRSSSWTAHSTEVTKFGIRVRVTLRQRFTANLLAPHEGP
jgi:hypothetical protein